MLIVVFKRLNYQYWEALWRNCIKKATTIPLIMGKEKICITGGSGLIGSHLTKFLLAEGYEVVHLSRNKNSKGRVKVYLWDYKKGHIESDALKNCHHLIHLAGAGIAEERWTFKRKKVLIESRVDSSAFLCQYIKENKIPIKTYITSSGINLYSDQNDIVHDESSPAGEEFLSKLVYHWEKASFELNDYCNVAQVRTSVVLDKHGGALKKISDLVKLHLGSPVGSGKQWIPWIHHSDLCGIFLHIIRQELNGPFNAVADQHVNNAQFTRTIAKVLNKKMILPKVPAAMITAAYGEMGSVVLQGVRASNQKIKASGFQFKYENLETALNDIYGK